jgi:hypothetical protein
MDETLVREINEKFAELARKQTEMAYRQAMGLPAEAPQADADSVLTVDKLRAVFCALRNHHPVPIGLWFVDRGDAYREVDAAFRDIINARRSRPRLSLFMLLSVHRLQRYQWRNPATEGELVRAKLLGLDFVTEPGIWLQMSDGKHRRLLDDYFHDKSVIPYEPMV